MMMSDIYRACEDGDVNLLKVLIDTSPPGSEINLIESNGNTPLHIACKNGHTDIVQLLLYKYNVDPDKLNVYNQTAYEEVSDDKIHQLFHRLKKDKYRFCSDENSTNPLQVIKPEHPSDTRWLHHYSNDSPILTELYCDVIDQQRAPYIAIFNAFRSFFGNDPYKKKIEKCSMIIQSMINQTLSSNSSKYIHASKLIQTFKKTGNIEYLLKLYTLHKDLCEFIGKDQDNTNYFYAPIKDYLYTVEHRAYKGDSYRGLTMTKVDFDAYKYAFKNKGSYIGTNTFCSTSIDLSTARLFADSGDIQYDKVKVLIKFHFVEPCSTAIILFSNLPHFQSISNYDEELEILILPKTIFSVEDIQQDHQTGFPIIHLQHYNTDQQQAEMDQERLESFINSVILD